MQGFAFHRPASVDDAVSALKAAGEGGKLLAGGQSLLPVLKLDLAAPTDLISLADVEGLKGIKEEGDIVVIGAAATHAEVAESGVVKRRIPALADLAGRIGDPQVRNRGTIGGSIAHADPAADYPAAVLGLGATVVTNSREIGADDFFVGMFATALAEDEIITAVRFPAPSRAAYAKFPHPASKYAIVGVMVSEGPAGIRVGVTGATPVAFRATAMEEALAKDFSPEALAGNGVDSDDLLSDADASADYRAHLVSVMARRAVQACA